MLLTRELGGLGVSIGTSVAIEEGLAQSTVLPEQLWINVRTLFRNLYSSLDSKDKLNFNMIQEDLLTEMTLIEVGVSAVSPKIETFFYLPTYKRLPKLFSKAMLKVPKTPLQLDERSVNDAVLQGIIDLKQYEVNLQVCDTLIKGQDKNTFILTHHVVDLLSKRYFNQLSLLESHTGKIKKPNQWNTKIGASDIDYIPFNALTLQIFGDKATTFNAMSHSFKAPLLTLAKEKRWHALTTQEKVNSDINTIKDPVLKQFYKALSGVRVS